MTEYLGNRFTGLTQYAIRALWLIFLDIYPVYFNLRNVIDREITKFIREETQCLRLNGPPFRTGPSSQVVYKHAADSAVSFGCGGGERHHFAHYHQDHRAQVSEA